MVVELTGPLGSGVAPAADVPSLRFTHTEEMACPPVGTVVCHPGARHVLFVVTQSNTPRRNDGFDYFEVELTRVHAPTS